MTSTDRQSAAIRAKEAKARRKLSSDAANLLRSWYVKRKFQGVMSRNACDNIELAIDDLETGAL